MIKRMATIFLGIFIGMFSIEYAVAKYQLALTDLVLSQATGSLDFDAP